MEQNEVKIVSLGNKQSFDSFIFIFFDRNILIPAVLNFE